jgi:Undecaprenyl-phosphate glucose phosphotransferase
MLFRLNIYRLALKIVVYLLPFVAFELAWPLWTFSMASVGRPIMYAHRGHFLLLLFSSFVWAYMAEHYRVTNVDELCRERTGARLAWSAILATAVILLGVLYFGRNEVFPRALFVWSMFALLILTLLVHALFRFLYRNKLHLGRPIRILIIGADQFARHAATRFQHLSFSSTEVVGYVPLPGQELAVEVNQVYDLEHAASLNPGNGIDEAVLAIHPAQFCQIPEIIRRLEKLSVPVRAIVDLGEGVVVRERLFQLGRMQMLDLTTTPADLPDYVLLKRAFDICFSATVLLVTSPLIGLIALLVWMTSPGPIFFVQERIGLNGLPFRMYKFRTMRVTTLSESDTSRTSGTDPRRTVLGRFLRKTSLDELPQFFNVLKGDMSVVGPRPELTHFVNQLMQEVGRYNHRHCLRVGITGWAQVNGWRGNTSIEKRLECDLYYIQNWSFAFDLQIILLTVLSVLIGKNAY